MSCTRTHTGGLQEVRRLEKLRAKRAFEATLPPINDVERLPERQVSVAGGMAAGGKARRPSSSCLVRHTQLS